MSEPTFAVHQPASQQSDAVASLLSLSIAAANAPPIQVQPESQQQQRQRHSRVVSDSSVLGSFLADRSASHNASAGAGATTTAGFSPPITGSTSPVPVPVPVSVANPSSTASVSVSPITSGYNHGHGSAMAAHGHKQHRRLASTGKTRRRLSDAREAAARPSPAMLHGSPPVLSLASLSLSTSPPSVMTVSKGFASPSSTSASLPASTSATNSMSTSTSTSGMSFTDVPPSGSNPLSSSSDMTATTTTTTTFNVSKTNPIPIHNGNGSGTGTGKKRGVEHRCESCSKIYRHPSCLIKHRWEHTPHWREASKFVLSKHQQVQLLEAAAILAHLSPASTSLPEDRSLWPSFLSGGLVPPPSNNNHNRNNSLSSHAPGETVVKKEKDNGNVLLSSSVPSAGSMSRSGSTGPRMHDYAIGWNGSTVTQVRPGLLGVSNANANENATPNTPISSSLPTNPLHNIPLSMSMPITTVNGAAGMKGAGGGGMAEGKWSLPRSSVRSMSISNSGSHSSGSDEEDSFSSPHDHDQEHGIDNENENDVVIDIEGSDDGHYTGYGAYAYGRRYADKPGAEGYAYETYSAERGGPNDGSENDKAVGGGGYGLDEYADSRVYGRYPVSGWRNSVSERKRERDIKEEKIGEWDGMDMDMDMD